MVPDLAARLAELRSTIDGTVSAAQSYVDPDIWEPAPGSEAEGEVKNTETGPAGAWGERPARTAYALANASTIALLDQLTASAVTRGTLYGLMQFFRPDPSNPGRLAWGVELQIIEASVPGRNSHDGPGPRPHHCRHGVGPSFLGGLEVNGRRRLSLKDFDAAVSACPGCAGNAHSSDETR